MLYLCVTDIHDLTYNELRRFLPEAERARLDSKKSEDYRVSSAAGRLVASTLYRHVFKKDAPPIVLSKEGAPSFFGEDIGLSISHSGRMVAAILSDCRTCVGIDIEECRAADESREKRREKIRERLRLPNVREYSELPPLYRASLSSERAALLPSQAIACTPTSPSAFLLDYTALEAVMKGEGKGFSALCDFQSIYPLYHLYCGMVLDDKNTAYILTIAEKCK